MVFIGLFFFELFLLFIFSRKLSEKLSVVLYRLTKSMKMTVNFLAFLYLPGTFLHELSHYLMALALFVKVGKFELMPKIESENRVKMGSVQIEEADIIRSLIIGLAPLILGIVILLFTLYFSISNFLKAYIAFEIGNTMFSSKKDVEGGVKIILVVLVLMITFLILGFRSNPGVFNHLLNERQSEIFKTADMYLLIPMIIDMSILYGLNFVMKKGNYR